MVGHFQGHRMNDSVVFGKPVVSPQRPDPGSGNKSAQSTIMWIMMPWHRILWVLKTTNPNPFGFVVNFTEKEYFFAITFSG